MAKLRHRAQLPPRCGSVTELSVAEWIFLDTLPYATTTVARVLACELQQHHAGPHVAAGQDSGTDEWWLRWDGQLRQTVCLPPCPARQAADELPCLLPVCHEGSHSFDLQPR